MKKINKLMVTLCLMFALVVTSFAVTPATVSAAGQLKFTKSITLMMGDGAGGDMGYGIMNSVKSDKILNLKSSNTKVLTVKKSKFIDDYTIMMHAKKAGTSTISFAVKRKNGKVYRFTSKVTVRKYANPLSKFTFGKTDYKKKFDKNKMVNVRFKTATKEKVNITAKKGYKIIGIYYGTYGNGTQKKIKNGSTVKLDEMHYLRVDYKNLSKKYSYEIYLNGVPAN